jgi:lipopolysaccharide/colanic/teichoic acid biosynthesis glycosyltransferase
VISPKRAFDVGASLAALAVLAPVWLAIALLIKADDGGPVLFRQERVGRGGRRFRILKFRTMVAGAEALGGPLTADADPRVTRLGRRLRATRLDELPQLVNVLRGEMTLVGPRPEVPRYTARYGPAERRVLELVPGLTDPASLAYRDEGRLLGAAADAERRYLEEVLPRKVRLQLAYADDATLWSDLRVLAATVRTLLPSARAGGPSA